MGRVRARLSPALVSQLRNACHPHFRYTLSFRLLSVWQKPHAYIELVRILTAQNNFIAATVTSILRYAYAASGACRRASL
jgi:hypothetical protein